jgi:DNA-binding beta-propeller fold protein YncE
MAFARTEWNLYRAENFGLAWVAVNNLQSTPTAIAIANAEPAKVYVGTMDRGVLVSSDGRDWTTANDGLNYVAGSRLMVNDLAIDPLQPEVLYVATSFLYGTNEIHQSPAGVAISTDGATAWSPINEAANMAVAELLPVSGLTGGVYALTTDSRTPQALGNAPIITEAAVAAQPVAEPTVGFTSILAWVVAGLAALALIFAVAMDLRNRRPEAEPTLSTSPVRSR